VARSDVHGDELATARLLSPGDFWLTPEPKSTGHGMGPADDPNRRVPVGGFVKRLLDVVMSLTALLLLFPLMLAAAAAIKLTMGGPVLFCQPRIGANGKRFFCYKFRTMRPNAEAILQDILSRDPAKAREWAETRKLRQDPRITRLGRYLRCSSVDELPQLLNVLRGDMSCIGPRPIVDQELEPYGVHAREYLAARPGMTGLWQVSGRNNLSYARRVEIDTSYVRNWSLWLDIKIIVLTIPALFRFHETV